MSRSDKYNYIKGGIQISGATHSSEGTLGYIVRNEDTMRAAVLTNKHVVSDDQAAQEIDQNIKLILQRTQYGKKPPCSEKTCEQLARGFSQGRVRPVFQPAYMGGTNPAARIVAFVSRLSGVSDAALCEVADDFVNYSAPRPMTRPRKKSTKISN